MVIIKDGHILRIDRSVCSIYEHEQGNLSRFGVAPDWRETHHVTEVRYFVDGAKVSAVEFREFADLLGLFQ
jgi:hypothetical protein